KPAPSAFMPHSDAARMESRAPNTARPKSAPWAETLSSFAALRLEPRSAVPRSEVFSNTAPVKMQFESWAAVKSQRKKALRFATPRVSLENADSTSRAGKTPEPERSARMNEQFLNVEPS